MPRAFVASTRHGEVRGTTATRDPQSNRYRVRVALGRTKNGRPQRAGGAGQPEAAEPDKELDSYLAALAPEGDVETTGSGRRFGSSQVYQLRLPLMANERLKELAARQGTSPAALARDWVMQHLAPDNAPGQQPMWPQDSSSEQPTQQQLAAPQPGPQNAGPQQPPQPPVAQPNPQYQQHTGDLYSAGSDQYHPDQYVPAETDTEITVPGGQYYR